MFLGTARPPTSLLVLADSPQCGDSTNARLIVGHEILCTCFARGSSASRPPSGRTRTAGGPGARWNGNRMAFGRSVNDAHARRSFLRFTQTPPTVSWPTGAGCVPSRPMTFATVPWIRNYTWSFGLLGPAKPNQTTTRYDSALDGGRVVFIIIGNAAGRDLSVGPSAASLLMYDTVLYKCGSV